MNLTINFDRGNRGRRYGFQLPPRGSPTPTDSVGPLLGLDAPWAPEGALRIAHVTPYDLAVSGGVNATVRELVIRQRRLGHMVDVIGGASSESPAIPHWRRIRSAVISVPANGSMAALCLPMAPEEEGEIDRVLKQGQYDVLVLHEPSLPMCALTLRLSTCANVGTMHAYGDTLRPTALMMRLLVPPLERLHRCIAVSDAARNYAMTYLDAPYAVIPNGIDVSDAPTPVHRATDEVLFAGRPEPCKGLDALLQALPVLRRWVPNAHLVIVGDAAAEDWAAYRTLAGQLGPTDAVSFLGRVSDADKRRLFEHATVFCSPATGGESQGGVLQDPELAGRLAAAGRQTVEQMYAWSTVIPRLLAEYRAAVAVASTAQGMTAA
jgi:phosphatidyl-myo-inositol alpha-mannosyltransferase